MHIKFKKLNDSAVIPFYAKDGDAGMDLVCTSLDDSNDLYFEYGTGLAIEIPKGCAGFLFPRSSISKTSHSLRNSVGVIDSGYRGEVKLRMSVPTDSKSQYKIGDKIGQLIIIQIPWIEIEEVKELSDTHRGEGGFGSTGQ
jgi:dUTP pyrophosphatase